MPTWGALLGEVGRVAKEMGDRAPGDPSPYDLVRRKYISQLSSQTGRATIVYATAFLEPRQQLNAQQLQIALGDVQGFMEAVSNVSERELDLVLTSPGGSAEAADSIMGYLRTRFDHIRAVVPVAAMSAATMMALACDEIVMGAHSQLGPIDPQITVFTPEGPRAAPAQAIIDQFELAKLECQVPANLAAWLPMLRSLLPGLLAVCANQRQLAEQFAERALAQHMFAGDADAAAKAKSASQWFSDYTDFKSHGRRVSRDEARAQGLKVVDLESDQDLQDAVLSVHHAVRLVLANANVNKLIENQHGRAYIEASPPQAPVIEIGLPTGLAPISSQPQAPRAERRRQQRQNRR